MNYPAKKPITRCPVNGCGVVIPHGDLCCAKCWQRVPKSLQATYAAEKSKADPDGDSLAMAAQACIEAAESDFS